MIIITIPIKMNVKINSYICVSPKDMSVVIIQFSRCSWGSSNVCGLLTWHEQFRDLGKCSDNCMRQEEIRGQASQSNDEALPGQLC